MPATRHDDQAGFTLLETLVGFLILSVALGVLSQAVFLAATQIDAAKDRKVLWRAIESQSLVTGVEATERNRVSVDADRREIRLQLGGIPTVSRTFVFVSSAATFTNRPGITLQSTSIEGSE